MKKLLIGFTVLLVHTAAARAQQVAPAAPDALPPPPPPTPGPAPAPSPPPTVQEMPPAYAPPPGYVAPAAPPAYGAPPVYGPPPPVYPPPVYRPYRYAPPPPYRYAPPPPYRYAPAPYYTPYVPPQRDVLNRPFTLGGGIGFGGLIFNDQFSTNTNVHRDGLSYTFRLGFGLRPGLLLLWDVEGTAANYGNSSVMQTANLVALQVFCTQRFFLKGGFGFAGASQDSLPTQWGGAAMGGMGYELAQGWNWSFDIEATITGAHINNNGVDQVWTNWSLLNFALNFF